MNKYLIIFMFALFTSFSFAQEGVKVNKNSVSVKEIAPVWPGCETSKENSKSCFSTQVNAHIKKNFKFPKDAEGGLVRGRTVISFLIDETGKVSNVKATGDHQALNEEAMRIVCLFPKMKPGIRGGKNVPISYKMPFNF